MTSTPEVKEAPGSQNGQQQKRSFFEAKKKTFKAVFGASPNQLMTFATTLVTDREVRRQKIDDIEALLSTGLFNRENFTTIISKVPNVEKEVQIKMLTGWIKSDNRPSKEECIAVMDTFSANHGHLSAKIWTLRQEDFPISDMAKMFIDGKITVTEEFYQTFADDVDILMQQKVR